VGRGGGGGGRGGGWGRVITRVERPDVGRLGSCMVKRSENGNVGGLWLEGHGLPKGSEVLDLSSRVRKAATSLHKPSDEPLEASCGLAKTATLTIC